METLIARYQQAAKTHAATNGVGARRNKSIMDRRNLGTIKQLAKKKTESGADQLDCILRVLRLRATSHKEARRFLGEALAQRGLSSGHQSDRPLPPLPHGTTMTGSTTTFTMQR